MGGFKSFVSAERFCRVYDEVRDFFRARSQRKESVPLAWQRALHGGRTRVFLTTLGAAKRSPPGRLLFSYSVLDLKVDTTLPLPRMLAPVPGPEAAVVSRR